MVRNSGGNKAKKFASKSFNISNKTTRFAMEINEIYAIVQRMLGGNMCEVLCIDGSIKQCHSQYSSGPIYRGTYHDNQDAEVFITGNFEQDDIKYAFNATIEFKDNEYNDIKDINVSLK